MGFINQQTSLGGTILHGQRQASEAPLEALAGGRCSSLARRYRATGRVDRGPERPPCTALPSWFQVNLMITKYHIDTP